MNVAELITELDALRPELAGYLVSKGVSASETEGLASLVDKVASISTGSGGIIPTGTLDIVSNGSVDVAAYAMANVNVPTPEIALQEKSVTPSAVAQTVVADEGYGGLSEVEVGAIPEEYAVLPTFTKTPATAPHILSGYQAVNNKNELVTGDMTKWSGTRWYTSTLDIQSIKQGYHDGSTKYGISTTEAEKIIPENIKSGVTILGVTGTAGNLAGGYKTVELNADRLDPNGVLSAAVPGTFLFAVAAVRNASGNNYDSAGARAGYLNSQSSVRIYENGTTKMATLAYDGTNITLTNVYDEYYLWNVKVIAVYEE